MYSAYSQNDYEQVLDKLLCYSDGRCINNSIQKIIDTLKKLSRSEHHIAKDNN